MQEQAPSMIDWDLFNGTTLQALADLSLIEDGHPTHMTTDSWTHASGTERPDKSKQIDKWIEEFRTSLCDAIANQDVAAANKAADALEPILYMLATYNFDSARRFAIMHFALQPIGKKKKANAFLTQSITDDDQAINHTPFPPDKKGGIGGWRARAKVAWKRLDAWHDSIKDRAHAHRQESLL